MDKKQQDSWLEKRKLRSEIKTTICAVGQERINSFSKTCGLTGMLLSIFTFLMRFTKRNNGRNFNLVKMKRMAAFKCCLLWKIGIANV